MPTPRVTIDALPEQATPEDANWLVVQDDDTTKKLSIATLKTLESTALAAHLADTSDVHAASSISSTDSGHGIDGTTVQGQLGQLASVSHTNTTAIDDIETALAVKDVVWVGSEAPEDPVVEMWWDSNAPANYLGNTAPTLTLPWINVKEDFGAVGDGVADDTEPIQAAINAAITSGNDLIFPAGDYNISDTLTVTQAKGLRIHGARSGLQSSFTVHSGAWLIYTGATLEPMVTFADCQNLTWEGVGFHGNNVSDGILITSSNAPVSTNLTFRDLHMYRVGTGIYLNNAGGTTQSDQMIFESIRMNEIITNGVRTNSSNVTGIKFLRCSISMTSTATSDVICFNLQKGALIDIDTCVGSRGHDFVRLAQPVTAVTLNSCQWEGTTHATPAFVRLGATGDAGIGDTTIMRGCIPDAPVVLSGPNRRLISEGNYWHSSASIKIDGNSTRMYSYAEDLTLASSISITGTFAQLRRLGHDSDGAPTSGAHYIGEILLDTRPNTNGAAGYVCSVAGTPGTWKPFGSHSQGGTTPGIITGSGCTAMTVTGNQFTGTIAFTIPAGFTVDNTAVGITYAVTHGFIPRALITPMNAAAAAAQPFVSLFAGQFNILLHAPPAGATAMTFTYQINV